MDHGLYASLVAIAILVSVGLFFGMLVLMEAGRRIGARRRQQDPAGYPAGVGAVEGAVCALLGLLVAFTFSVAASRLDTRRQLIIEETNNIGTAYLPWTSCRKTFSRRCASNSASMLTRGWLSIEN